MKTLNSFADESATTLTNFETKFPKFVVFLDMRKCTKKIDFLLPSLEEIEDPFANLPSMDKEI